MLDGSRSGIESTTPSPLPEILRTPAGLAIVEIQGSLHAPEVNEGETSSERVVGRLVFPDLQGSADVEDRKWMKRVWMYIGANQRLVGEVKQLAKPLGVLSRRNAEDEAEELEIADVVRYKLLFTGRPEPVGERT